MNSNKNCCNFLKFLYDLYNGMKEYEITMAYEGDINHQLIKTFSSVTEDKLSREDESEIVQKKVYHVMIECLQNITKHALIPSISASGNIHKGLLMISVNKSEYHVVTGNLINNSRVNPLRKFIEKINSLEKDELNELYKKQLKEGRISKKGGAGLGFIDIKRKTGGKLEYQFLPLSDNISFFLFTSAIPRNIK